MRNRREQLRCMVISAVMAALALTLPMAFHAAGLGSKFLPMLLPLLLNGFLVPVPWAAVTGAVVPPLSSLATGMPPMFPPVAMGMSIEGAILGGAAAAIYGGQRSRLWWALLIAVFLGRAAAFASTWLLARLFQLPPTMTSAAVLIQGIPGVVLQLAVVPVVVGRIARRGGILFAHDSQSQA